MSNPEKRWSWGAAFGRGVGPVIPSAASGALIGSLGGPLGPVLGAAIAAATAFANGFLGAVVGHWWDLPAQRPESFGSAALFTLVVSGVLNLVAGSFLAGVIAAAPRQALPIVLLTGLVAFIASASRSLLDDWNFGRPSRDSGREASTSTR
jgi:hypothetical protein